MSLIAEGFAKIFTPKDVVTKMTKKVLFPFDHLLAVILLTDLKQYWSLHGSIFILFMHHSKSNWVGKRVF